MVTLGKFISRQGSALTENVGKLNEGADEIEILGQADLFRKYNKRCCFVFIYLLQYVQEHKTGKYEEIGHGRKCSQIGYNVVCPQRSIYDETPIGIR